MRPVTLMYSSAGQENSNLNDEVMVEEKETDGQLNGERERELEREKRGETEKGSEEKRAVDQAGPQPLEGTDDSSVPSSWEIITRQFS